jgi:tetratricopeptide (TPR) repeat protein
MARSRSKPSPRLLVGARDAPRAGGVELRLAIGRDGIGLELANPTPMGCLRVVDLRTTFPGLRFPMDVSGGVARFRHRRAELQHLRVELQARPLEHWALPRLRGLVSEGTPNLWLRVAPAQATVCVSADQETTGIDSGAPALAFEIHALLDQDVSLIVSCARGVGLSAAPTALAVACVEAVLGTTARRSGAEFTLPTPAAALLKALLPEAGARAASVRGVRWAIDSVHEDRWTLRAERDGAPGDPTEAAQRAQELARLLHRADDMLVAGDSNRARAGYMAALERAPRHPEIVQRIADIDARVPGREEAVLGLMAECATGSRPCPFGVTRSELLARVGQTRASLASFEQAVEDEPGPGLAGRLCELAAASTDDADAIEIWLDRALAACPRSPTARWARARNRLRLGRATDALGDVQHLDASSRHDRDRHDIWVRAGKAWQDAGLHSQAASLFERALLYVPDEPEALAGLGAALVETGATARGTSLLARASDLASERRLPSGWILLSLARALAEGLGDLPAGIARVSQVPREARESIVARGLEGRWRARLGDLAGASLAFATLRDLASSFVAERPSDQVRASSERGDSTDEIVKLLCEGAEFERTRHHDELAAETYRAEARRLRPSVDAESSEAPRLAQEPGAPLREARTGLDWNLEPEPSPPPESAEMAARVEDLTRRFQADPDDHAVADELASLLESLGRSHELLALLSARLDDAAPDERALLLPRVKAALERLAIGAESAGRAGEASLYRSALDALPE